MKFGKYRARAVLVCIVAVCLTLAFAASSSALEHSGGLSGVPRPTSPECLPRLQGPAVGASLAAVPIQMLGADAFEGVQHLSEASSVSASDVALPFDGGYYWAGTYLVMDGWVTNDTAADVGPVLLHFEIRTSAGVAVAEQTVAAAVYNLRPGEMATFRGIVDLPAHAGSDMTVLVSSLAAQPTLYPSAVDLTLVDLAMATDADGARMYTCTFRNDATFAVRAPIVGGVELNAADEVIDTLFGFDAGLTIEPGATAAVQAYGTYLGATPASAQIYAQAIPVPQGSHDPVFRFFNPHNGSHFYTPSAEERDAVISRWPNIFRYEGVAYFTNPATNNQPLYRFFYRRGGTHFYTADVSEAALILERWPHIFTYEGTTYPVSRSEVAGAATVYRFINRKTSSHFYTASAAERDLVQSRWSSTYIYEGPAFWIAE